jgi:hypothetical protein
VVVVGSVVTRAPANFLLVGASSTSRTLFGLAELRRTGIAASVRRAWPAVIVGEQHDLAAE